MGRVLARADSIRLYSAQTDSFPFSAESNFRELDDVFLQTQTRIWLGEVLKIRLEEERSIADLLADGRLLFEVSKVIWKMLLTMFMKLRSSKAYFSISPSGKNKGRYMPYSNVDSFLKICQILGLTGIDLFSPSDVVEKRDIRRVCMCIRSLSKKSRSKDLNVPDFDVVTYTVAMPTDMVKGIRNSLEQSQFSFSEDSAGCSKYLVSRSKNGQKNWGADFARHYDSYSEEFDSVDSNYQVFGFDSPSSPTSCSGASLLNSDMESSPRGSSVVVENFHLTQCMFQTDGHDEEIDGHNNGSYSPSPEAKGSLNRFTDTLQDGRISPSGFDYLMEPSAGTFHGKKEPIRTLNTPEDERIRVSPVNLDLESCADNYKSEGSVFGQSGASDKNGCGTNSDESAVFGGHRKDFVFDLHRETNFHGSDSVYKTSIYPHGKKCFEEIEDADVSFTAFFDLGKADTEDYTFAGKDTFSTRIDRSTLNTDKLQVHLNLKEVDSAKPLPIKECQLTIISDDDDLEVSRPNIKVTNEDVRENPRNSSLSGDCSSTSIESTSEALNATTYMLATKEEKCIERNTSTLSMVIANHCVGHQSGSENRLWKMPTGSGNDGREAQSDPHILDEDELKSAHQACTICNEDVASSTGNLDKDTLNHKQAGRDVGASDHKRRRKRLLKSFAGGISVFGVFLLFFHLRRPNGREKINETSVPPKQIWKTNKGEPYGKNREQKGRADGVYYPAEKLRF